MSQGIETKEDLVDFTAGLFDGILSQPYASHSSGTYKAGKLIGHTLKIAIGLGGMYFGLGGAAGGITISVSGVGAAIGVPAVWQVLLLSVHRLV